MSVTRAPDGFVLDPASTGMTLAFHADGVGWWDAPVPRRWHRCRIQTWAYDHGQIVNRCACGAIRFPLIGASWLDRNTRRRSRGDV